MTSASEDGIFVAIAITNSLNIDSHYSLNYIKIGILGKIMKQITLEYLKSRLDYFPLIGNFRWKFKTSSERYVNGWNGKHAGRIAGNTWLNMYRTIKIDGVRYPEHVLAWFYMTGCWPIDEIDHKDTNGLNNKFDNLRESNRSQNNMNKRTYKTNRLGVKGVMQDPRTGKYVASIQADNKGYWLGTFLTLQEASDAYQNAAIRLHKEFSRF